MSVVAPSQSRHDELMAQFPLRPLRSEAAYRRAMAAADTLAVKDEGTLTTDEQDYLETLSLLIASYENSHNPVDLSGVEPLDVLRHLMDESDMTTTALGKLIGSKGIASEILNGKRSLSKNHIGILAAHFGVDPGVFLRRRK